MAATPDVTQVACATAATNASPCPWSYFPRDLPGRARSPNRTTLEFMLMRNHHSHMRNYILEPAAQAFADAASRLAVAGDSVGGNMTAALTLLAKQLGDVRFVHQ